MSELNTLRALAGLPLEPAALSDSTLILIDCQNTYTYGVMELEGVQAALDEAAVLLDRARSAGIPIIHVQHDDGPGSLYDVSGDSGAIVERVAPRDGEQVVVKNYPNSFVGTDLDERLKSLGAENLIIAGFMTHMCVTSTARGAFNLGYSPTVVAAAIATRALPGVAEREVSAEDLQAASLAAVADLFAVVVADSDAILASARLGTLGWVSVRPGAQQNSIEGGHQRAAVKSLIIGAHALDSKFPLRYDFNASANKRLKAVRTQCGGVWARSLPRRQP